MYLNLKTFSGGLCISFLLKNSGICSKFSLLKFLEVLCYYTIILLYYDINYYTILLLELNYYALVFLDECKCVVKEKNV